MLSVFGASAANIIGTATAVAKRVIRIFFILCLLWRANPSALYCSIMRLSRKNIDSLERLVGGTNFRGVWFQQFNVPWASGQYPNSASGQFESTDRLHRLLGTNPGCLSDMPTYRPSASARANFRERRLSVSTRPTNSVLFRLPAVLPCVVVLRSHVSAPSMGLQLPVQQVADSNSGSGALVSHDRS